MYNLTTLQNASNVAEIVEFTNTNTDGMLMGLAIISIFFIMLMVLKRWEFDDALLSSSFVCFVLSLILSFGQWISFMYPLTFLILSAFTAFYVFVTKR